MLGTGIIFVILTGFTIYALRKLKPKPKQPFPSHWHNLLLDHVSFYKALTPENQKRFQHKMMQFLSEINIEGVKLKLQELDTVLIAASAIIPVFGFTNWHYTNLSGVLLYPDNFNEEFDFAKNKSNKIIAGMVGTGRLEKQMILSKKALYHGFSNTNDKNNTAIHEFVHLIDKMDGDTDGIPEYVLQNAYIIPWLNIIHKEMNAIHKNTSDIRSYGGTNQAEFFAVASEYFFENPKLMKRKHPELYKLLKTCFNPSN